MPVLQQKRALRNRAKILRTATRLFRRKGYAATGLIEILDASGCPKGSLYHYFPGGKEEIGSEVVRSAAARVERMLRELASEAHDPVDFVRRYTATLIQWLEASDYRDGCPIATTVLETVPDSSAIGERANRGFEAWTRTVESSFQRDVPGAEVEHADAAQLATSFVAAIEGALLLARAQRSSAPLRAVETTFTTLLVGRR